MVFKGIGIFYFWSMFAHSAPLLFQRVREFHEPYVYAHEILLMGGAYYIFPTIFISIVKFSEKYRDARFTKLGTRYSNKFGVFQTVLTTSHEMQRVVPYYLHK